MSRETYFFLLSGEYEGLPAAELRSTLRILDPDCEFLYVASGRVAAAKTVEKTAREAVIRAAFTKLSGKLVIEVPTDEKAILNSVGEDVLRAIFPRGAKTFMVRGKRIQGVEVNMPRLERIIGAKVLEKMPWLKVSLTKPDVTVFILSSREKTFIGPLVAVKPRKFFADRIAGRRPFSLPSAMQPDFSRAMVNLAEVSFEGRILDPFAGTGGILIEAGLMEYMVYGVEFKDWIARGGLRNLERYIPGRKDVIVGDARALMFREECFDAIVTDPPYGRSTTVPDESISTLLSKFFQEGTRVLKKKGRIVLAVPADIDLKEIASKHGLRIVEEHTARVHGSLTRRVVVLEK
ncbi:MAG: RsmD family RNA methyltransferase [Thaumarchaeota archaeon]|nr:RsmD family RNA methyltransferase [Nitrososphaerota archaeon]